MEELVSLDIERWKKDLARAVEAEKLAEEAHNHATQKRERLESLKDYFEPQKETPRYTPYILDAIKDVLHGATFVPAAEVRRRIEEKFGPKMCGTDSVADYVRRLHRDGILENAGLEVRDVDNNDIRLRSVAGIVPILPAIVSVLEPGKEFSDRDIAGRLQKKYPDQEFLWKHVTACLRNLGLNEAAEAGLVVRVRGEYYVGARLTLKEQYAELDSAICSVLDAREINTDAVRRRMSARDISESDFCIPVAARIETWLQDPTSRPEGVFVEKSPATGATVVRLKRTKKTALPPIESINGRVVQALKKNKYMGCTDVTEACGLRAGDVQRVYEHWDANPKECPAGVILRKEEGDVVGARLMTKAEEDKSTAPQQTELQGLESKEERIIAVLNAKTYLRQDEIAVRSGVTQNEVVDILHSWRRGEVPENVRIRMKNPPGGNIEAKLKKKAYKQPSRSNPYLQWIVGFCRARGYTSKSKAVTRRFIYNEMAKAKPSWAQRVKGGDLHGTVGARLDEVRKGTRNATPIQQFKKGRHVRLWVKPLEK